MYAPTSNTASHDNHEKINSWISFSFLFEYGALLVSKLLCKFTFLKCSFVKEGVETRRKGLCKAELTLSRLYVKPLITTITAIVSSTFKLKILYLES